MSPPSQHIDTTAMSHHHITTPTSASHHHHPTSFHHNHTTTTTHQNTTATATSQHKRLKRRHDDTTTTNTHDVSKRDRHAKRHHHDTTSWHKPLTNDHNGLNTGWAWQDTRRTRGGQEGTGSGTYKVCLLFFSFFIHFINSYLIRSMPASPPHCQSPQTRKMRLLGAFFMSRTTSSSHIPQSM